MLSRPGFLLILLQVRCGGDKNWSFRAEFRISLDRNLLVLKLQGSWNSIHFAGEIDLVEITHKILSNTFPQASQQVTWTRNFYFQDNTSVVLFITKTCVEQAKIKQVYFPTFPGFSC